MRKRRLWRGYEESGRQDPEGSLPPDRIISIPRRRPRKRWREAIQETLTWRG